MTSAGPAHLTTLGYQVRRYTNRDIEHNLESVLQEILEYVNPAQTLIPPPSPAKAGGKERMYPPTSSGGT